MPKARKRKCGISTDTAFKISDFLEIEDMVNWSKALSMESAFKKKILNARRMQNLHCLGANSIQVLIKNNFHLTFNVLQQLYNASREPPEIPDDEIFNEHIRNNRVSFYLASNPYIYKRGISKHFFEAHSVSVAQELDVYSGKLPELDMPLTRERAALVQRTASFLLYSDLESIDRCAILLEKLLSLAGGKKRVIICCEIKKDETSVQTLVRHLRIYHQRDLLFTDDRIPRNLEFHAVSFNEVALEYRDTFRTDAFIIMYESCFKCGINV